MRPTESVNEFEVFAEGRGVDFVGLSVRTGIEQMIGFFEEVKPSGCARSRGDALLYQWGTYDWGKGENFELNLTRQFIENGESGDDAISQLQMTFSYPASAQFRAFGSGNRWCWSKEEVPGFRQFILSRPEFLALADAATQNVSVRHEYV